MHIQTFVMKNLWHLSEYCTRDTVRNNFSKTMDVTTKNSLNDFKLFRWRSAWKKCYISYFSSVCDNKPMQVTMYGSPHNKGLTVANTQWHSHSKSVKCLPQSIVIVTGFILNLGNYLPNSSSNCLLSVWSLDHVTRSVSGDRELNIMTWLMYY